MSSANTPHQAAAADFLQRSASGDVRGAYAQYIGEGFRHHNAHFPGDAQSLMIAMEDNARQFPDKSLEIKQLIEGGDRVVVLSHVRMKPGDTGIALVHIFRFAGDRVVELWDLGQPIPEGSPNTNGMF